MDCLELPIHPLPQLITVGHSFWSADMQHFERNFDVYDVLLIKQGRFFMTENDKPYELEAGDILVLEPGKTHWGQRPCGESTELYWFHFLHDKPLRTVPAEDISWKYIFKQGTDHDLRPTEQLMYVPKYGRIDLGPILPILDDMYRLHNVMSVDSALELQSLFTILLSRLQAAAMPRTPVRSRAIADLTTDYIRRHRYEPFKADQMEKELSFRFDYLARCMKQHTGMSPLQFAHHLRINEGKELLVNSTANVQQIAEQLGFENANYFIRLFRQTTGTTPLQYRKSRTGFV
ncbi:hypothetical protein SY83_21860 [Paenibacillus swuensis]|uniref:HTH araC/xylS-type domain-containing protein n=1 Tax=Paenibacillus swuensis TaxID=1178515 RepID=A0A172TQS8_9BACL|nr:hypothetical protein SY83_21860 [Paenibacillus swuensis]